MTLTASVPRMAALSIIIYKHFVINVAANGLTKSKMPFEYLEQLAYNGITVREIRYHRLHTFTLVRSSGLARCSVETQTLCFQTSLHQTSYITNG